MWNDLPEEVVGVGTIKRYFNGCMGMKDMGQVQASRRVFVLYDLVRSKHDGQNYQVSIFPLS